jgi:hypothetical protein
VRWLAGNGADTALAGVRKTEAKAVCALTPSRTALWDKSQAGFSSRPEQQAGIGECREGQWLRHLAPAQHPQRARSKREQQQHACDHGRGLGHCHQGDVIQGEVVCIIIYSQVYSSGNNATS